MPAILIIIPKMFFNFMLNDSFFYRSLDVIAESTNYFKTIIDSEIGRKLTLIEHLLNFYYNKLSKFACINLILAVKINNFTGIYSFVYFIKDLLCYTGVHATITFWSQFFINLLISYYIWIDPKIIFISLYKIFHLSFKTMFAKTRFPLIKFKHFFTFETF